MAGDENYCNCTGRVFRDLRWPDLWFHSGSQTLHLHNHLIIWALGVHAVVVPAGKQDLKAPSDIRSSNPSLPPSALCTQVGLDRCSVAEGVQLSARVC